jgi:hypothetical protein
MARQLIILMVGFIIASSALGEIYRYKDSNGNTVYSDKAPKNTKPMEFPDLNTTPAVEVAAESETSTKVVSQSVNTIRIQHPSNGQVFPNGRIPITISISTNSQLMPDQRISFNLDGKTLAESSALQYTIPRLSRGPHQITAAIIDQNGKSISSSTVHIISHWPSN